MLTETLVNLLVKVFIMALAGYVMRKTKLMDDVFSANISNLLLYVVIPASMLSAGNSVYSAALGGGLLAAAGIAAGYYVLGYLLMWLLARALPLPGAQKGLMVNLVMLGNFGYIGFPIITELLGAEGALYNIIINLGFQLVAFTVGVRMLGEKPMTPRAFLTNPMTLAPVLAILFFVSPLRLPAAVVSTLDLVGGMSAPISMFIIGGSLAKIKLSSLLTSGWAWLVALLRQVAAPLAVAGACLLFGVTGPVAATCVIIFGMPSGALNVIFAERYGADPPFATRAVVLSTILMAATLPATVLLAHCLFL